MAQNIQTGQAYFVLFYSIFFITFCNCNMMQSAARNLRLPILQVLRGNELIGELVCGDARYPLEYTVKKAHATIESIIKSNSLLHSMETETANDISYESMYSDEMLRNTLNFPNGAGFERYFILKLFSHSCPSCIQFEPFLDSLPSHTVPGGSEKPFSSYFHFIQANIEYTPQYLTLTRNRLAGLIPNANKGNNMDTCTTCKGKGLIPCSSCSGVGYSMKGSLAVFCNSCGGKKSIRCNNCGGRCISCS